MCSDTSNLSYLPLKLFSVNELQSQLHSQKNNKQVQFYSYGISKKSVTT